MKTDKGIDEGWRRERRGRRDARGRYGNRREILHPLSRVQNDGLKAKAKTTATVTARSRRDAGRTIRRKFGMVASWGAASSAPTKKDPQARFGLGSIEAGEASLASEKAGASSRTPRNCGR